MTEVWKPIKGYGGDYQVSSLGQVKSLKLNRAKLLKPCRISSGYVRVVLCGSSGCKGELIHRLVVESFIGKIPQGKLVNHKDLNKTNNCLENLEIVSCQENLIHYHDSRKKQGFYLVKGEKSPYGVVLGCYGVKVYLGYYKTAQKAQEVYVQAHESFFGVKPNVKII